MIHFFHETRVLRTEGKIHATLIRRTRMLFAIAAVLAAIVAYNTITRPVYLGVEAALIAIGFILGLFVFSRMNTLTWNEDESVVQTERMDMIGAGVIALYIVFEIGLRTFLNDFFPVSATTLLIGGIFGTIFGRAVGTVIEIHRVYRASHNG